MESHPPASQPGHCYFRINKGRLATRPVTRKNANKSLTLLIVDGISPNFAGELGLCCILEIPLEIAVLLTVAL